MSPDRAFIALAASIVLVAFPGAAHAQVQELPPVIVRAPSVPLPTADVTIATAGGRPVSVTVEGSVTVGGETMPVVGSCRTPCALHLAPGEYRVRSPLAGVDQRITLGPGIQRVRIHSTRGRGAFRAMSIAGPIMLPLGLLAVMCGTMMNGSTGRGDSMIVMGLVASGAGLLAMFLGGALSDATRGSVTTEPNSLARAIRRVHIGAALAGGGGLAASVWTSELRTCPSLERAGRAAEPCNDFRSHTCPSVAACVVAQHPAGYRDFLHMCGQQSRTNQGA